MATKVLKYGNYNSYLYVDYTYNVSGRSWTLDAGMYFYTGTANMGAWGNYGSTYLHTSNSGRGLAYTKAGSTYCVVDPFRITSGTYNDNGDAPYVEMGWSWGVNSSWGGYQKPSGTVGVTGSAIGKITYWNDINAYQPDGSTQNGLIFDLTTSDGGKWTNLTNEPAAADFTKPKGTKATISNIRSNVTGAHYSGNNVTNDTSGSFSWTFNEANWVCKIYTAWDTYTVNYNANGGSGAPGAQTKTYNVNLTLSSTKPTRSGYTFKGWATSASGAVVYQPGGTYTANAAATLYAVWEIDQAVVYYKNSSGAWVKGKVWYKNSSGTWVKAKRFYTKVNGTWKENKTKL